MGRLNHAASRVHSYANQILQNTSHTYPPPWLTPIQNVPPSEKLIRPALQRSRKARLNQKIKHKPSRMFQPVPVAYQEDRLRWEYFNDHPWELAKPRVVIEGDGKDLEKWDWSVELDVSLNRPKAKQRDAAGRTDEQWENVAKEQAGRPLNGEAVIQRQHFLLRHSTLTPPAAYDKARKELYRIRHSLETEQRVAREEALATGAFFGLGPLEIGMKLEDKAYENWRAWAKEQTIAAKQMETADYTGLEAEENEVGVEGEEQQELQEVAESVPSSRRGQEAKGGAAFVP